MIKRQLTITNQAGLHARPASTWVHTAGQYHSTIKVKKGGAEVDGKSILGVLSLGLSVGSQFQLIVDGPDEQEAAKTLEELIANLEKQDK